MKQMQTMSKVHLYHSIGNLTYTKVEILPKVRFVKYYLVFFTRNI